VPTALNRRSEGKQNGGGGLVGLVDVEEGGSCDGVHHATGLGRALGSSPRRQAADTGPRAPGSGGRQKQGTPGWLPGGVLATVWGGAIKFISNSNSNWFQIKFKSFQTLADPKRTFTSSKKKIWF
jgi:hypothetical protein